LVLSYRIFTLLFIFQPHSLESADGPFNIDLVVPKMLMTSNMINNIINQVINKVCFITKTE